MLNPFGCTAGRGGNRRNTTGQCFLEDNRKGFIPDRAEEKEIMALKLGRKLFAWNQPPQVNVGRQPIGLDLGA